MNRELLESERLNYCSQAIPDLNGIGDHIKNKRFGSPQQYALATFAYLTVQPLRDSFKFISPGPHGRLFENEEMAKKALTSLPEIKMPYDVMAVEYPSSDAACPKQIALAMTVERFRDYYPPNDIIGEDTKAVVLSVVYVAEGRTWALYPLLTQLKFVDPKDGAVCVATNRIYKSPFHIPAKEVTDEVHAVTQLIAALFHGVRYVNLRPPPRLNARRLAKKKPPFFEYRMLELHPRIVRLYDSAEPAVDKNGLPRRSPRLHARRGHWRHYADGTVSWIRQTMVGKKELGLVLNDYNTEPLATDC